MHATARGPTKTRVNILIPDWFTALAGGGALGLAFWPSPLAPLCLLVGVPVFVALAERTLAKAASARWLVGYAFGIGCFLSVFHWIPKLESDNLLYPWLIWPALAAMALYLGLYVGVAFLLGTSLLRRTRVPAWLVLAAAWTLLEWLRGQGVLGLPWAALGYAVAHVPILMQSVDLYGVHGLSFVLFGLSSVAHRPSRRGVGIALGALVLLLGYGALRMAETPAGAPLDVALIQPNFGGSEKWDPDNRERVMTQYFAQSDSVLGSRPADLLVWPETATPFRLLESRRYRPEVQRFVARTNTPLLTGTPHGEWRNDEPVYHNAALLIRPGVTDTAFYAKRQLVPFSEWLPWAWLRRVGLNFGQADFSPGDRVPPMRIGDHAAGVLICIEAIFPRLGRAAVQDGADFLVTITNDVWFGDSAAPYEHANMSRYRAVECRRPLVRCANTGISMLVSRTGRAERSLGTFIPGSLRGKIVPENTTTLFVRAGHWVVAVAGLVLAGAFGFRRERR